MFGLRLHVTRALGKSATERSAATRRLASGLRVSRAAEGASELAISTRLRAQRRTLAQAQRNTMDGVGVAVSAEEGVRSLQGVVSRMRTLALRAATGTSTQSVRDALDQEYKSLLGSYDAQVNKLRWGEQSLLGPGAANGAVQLQIGIHDGLDDRLDVPLNDVSLRRVGRLDPASGAAVVSSAPLGTLSVPEPALEAAINLSGAMTFEDSASLTGANTGPFTIDGQAEIPFRAGPYNFVGSAQRRGGAGPFTFPEADKILGADSESYDIVEGENDTLRLELDGVETLVTLPAGFRTPGEVAAAINDALPGAANVVDGRLSLQAAGEVGQLEIVGGSALPSLGWSAGSVSEASNSLVFSTPEGTHQVDFPQGTFSLTDVVNTINAVHPGVASADGGRLTLRAEGGDTFVSVGSGTANSALGLSRGTTRSADSLRYRVNGGAWQDVVFPEGAASAEEVRDVINARTPGVAEVVGGAVRLRSDTGAAQLHIGSGTANGVLGVANGQSDTGENLLRINVNGATVQRTLSAGTYTTDELVSEINAMHPGVASNQGGRIKLDATNPTGQAVVSLSGSTIAGAMGFARNARDVSNNTLRLRVNGGGERVIAFPGGALTPSEVADTINATFPGLAEVNGGGVRLVSEGAGASIRVGNGDANGALGVTNGQSSQAPDADQTFTFSVNGEPTTLRFPPGDYDPADIVRAINAERPGFATLLQDGRLRLATQAVGVPNTVTVEGGTALGGLGLSAGQSGSGVDTDSLALTGLNSRDGALQAYRSATQALDELTAVGAGLGTFINRADVISNDLSQRLEATEATRSRIQDADYAQEAVQAARAALRESSAQTLMNLVEAQEQSFAQLYSLIGG